MHTRNFGKNIASEQKEHTPGPISGVRNFSIHKLSAKCPGTTSFRRGEQSWPLRQNQQEEIISAAGKNDHENIRSGGARVHEKFIVIEPEKLSFFSSHSFLARSAIYYAKSFHINFYACLKPTGSSRTVIGFEHKEIKRMGSEGIKTFKSNQLRGSKVIQIRAFVEPLWKGWNFLKPSLQLLPDDFYWLAALRAFSKPELRSPSCSLCHNWHESH